MAENIVLTVHVAHVLDHYGEDLTVIYYGLQCISILARKYDNYNIPNVTQRQGLCNPVQYRRFHLSVDM